MGCVEVVWKDEVCGGVWKGGVCGGGVEECDGWRGVGVVEGVGCVEGWDGGGGGMAWVWGCGSGVGCGGGKWEGGRGQGFTLQPLSTPSGMS